MVMGAGPCNRGEWEPEHEWLARRARTCPPAVKRKLDLELETYARRAREVGWQQASAERDRSRSLGQIDPMPPPMRPVSWPTILGWTAVVGVTLAVFNGTINLGSSSVRANRRRRRSSKRMRRNAYPAWRSGYSNEDFDRAQQYAQELTDADRRAGRPAPRAGYSAERIEQATREVRDANVYSAASQRRTTRNAGRRSSHARPKPPKMSELGVWAAIGAVREAHPREHLDVLPPGVAAKFKKLPPGLYKYGYGPKKGEVITQFKKATLKGAMTSTRIGAKAVGEYHWVVDNFDPSFPVVVRGIDDHGRSYFRIEEYAKSFEKVPVMVRRQGTSR